MNKKELLKMIECLEKKIEDTIARTESLEHNVFKLEHPVKYKKGDKVIFYKLDVVGWTSSGGCANIFKHKRNSYTGTIINVKNNTNSWIYDIINDRYEIVKEIEESDIEPIKKKK